MSLSEGTRERVDLVAMLNSGNLIKVCAPMVRFTKLPFRQLVLKYGTDIAVTPMIMSDSFVRSQKARDNEFTTSVLDTPLIAQFAANNAKDFADAAELVHQYVLPPIATATATITITTTILDPHKLTNFFLPVS